MHLFRSECSSRTRFVWGSVCMYVCNILAPLLSPPLPQRDKNYIKLQKITKKYKKLQKITEMKKIKKKMTTTPLPCQDKETKRQKWHKWQKITKKTKNYKMTKMSKKWEKKITKNYKNEKNEKQRDIKNKETERVAQQLNIFLCQASIISSCWIISFINARYNRMYLEAHLS